MLRRGPRAACLVAVLLADAHAARPETLVIPPFNPAEANMVRIVRQGAMQRLRAPECGRVLADFRDPDGRTLVENLEPFRMEPDAYLETIAFLDGQNLPFCRSGRVYLATVIGERRVFVCRPFFRAVWQDRARVEISVIHEMLHTLKLGENPPSSAEITDQVLARCGG